MAKLANVRKMEPVKIMLDKEREVKFDLNAFAELEKKFGSVDEAMQKMQSGGMTSIKTILWVGLIHDEAILGEDGEPIGYNITPYQVGGWITMGNLSEVSDCLTRAMSADLPDQEVQKVQADLKAIATGTESKATVATVIPTEAEKAEAEKNA